MYKESINIETIKQCIERKNIIWTKHCLNRLNQRNILISDVKKAVSNGSIIEYYTDDYPYPSCLVLGKGKNNRNMHVVCAVGQEFVSMITAYYPDDDMWEKDMKTRREESELF